MDFDLRLACGTDAASLPTRLDGVGRLHRGPEEDGAVFRAEGVSLGVGGVTPAVLRLTEQESGFTPDTSVSFRVDKFDGLRPGLRTMLAVVQECLSACPADAVLLFNGEVPILRRSGGALVLNRSWGYWNDGLSSVLTHPFEWRELAPIA